MIILGFVLFPLVISSAKEKSAKKAPAGDTSEMGVYRTIVGREIAIRQDAADLLAMQAGEFDSLGTPEKRLKNAVDKKWLRDASAGEELSRGEAAKAIMLYFRLDKGIMFTITGWERYALFDVQENGIMQGKFSAGQVMSGEQLAGMFNAAEDFRQTRENWGKSVQAEGETPN